MCENCENVRAAQFLASTTVINIDDRVMFFFMKQMFVLKKILLWTWSLNKSQIPDPYFCIKFIWIIRATCLQACGDIVVLAGAHNHKGCMRMHLTGNGRLCAAKGSNLNNNIPLMHLQVQVQRHKKRDRNAIPAPVTNINTT